MLRKDGIGRFLQFDLNQVGLGSLLVRAGTGMSISRWQSSWWGGSWWDDGSWSQYSNLMMRWSFARMMNRTYNIEKYKENNLHCIFYEEVLRGDDCNGVEPEYDRNCILMMITILRSTRSTTLFAVRGTQEPSEGAARRWGGLDVARATFLGGEEY